jgi:hypothetical protein
MTAKAANKSREIRELVDRVAQSEVGSRVRVVDHWPADPHAIGFARRRGSSRIVYVSSWEQPANTFYWSIETRAGAMAREGAADTDEVIRLIDETFPATMSRAG